MSFQEKYYEAESFWSGEALMDAANQKRIDATVGLIPASCKSILDVGCGNGVFGRRLQETRPDIRLVGMDRSHAALRHVHFETHIGSSDNLPFNDASFDCVTCLQVIEHLPFGSYESTLKEIARVSSKFIIIGVPYKEQLENNTTKCPSCKAVFNLDLHLRSFDDSSVASLFDEFGFKQISSVFPGRRMLLNYVEVNNFLRRKAVLSNKFLSPICPVCGYSEGDSTPLANVHERTQAASSGPLGSGMLRKIAKRALINVWPKTMVDGYWIVALFSNC